MSLLLANIIGWITSHWRHVAIIIGIVVLFIVGVVILKSCKRPAKLNEAEIQKAQDAVKTRNDSQLREILATADTREKVIEGEVANSEANTKQAIQVAKEKYSNMNTDELAAELEKRKNQ